MHRFRGRLVALLATAAVMGGVAFATSSIALGSAKPQVTGVAPNPVNELDCNGFSSKYKSVKPDLGGLCTDPLSPSGVWGKTAGRFYDNGHYIGHDEPSVKFISTQPGSASNMTYYVKLSTDPRATPTANPGPNNTTAYAELSPAPWFGLPICDPLSYPQNPCSPQSNSNGGAINDPNAAGSAFMELQFYPPGFPPFATAPSCDQNKWCAALTIDSLEGTYGFTVLNPACEEPVNFAFLQTNGVPAGPPSPQLSDAQTFAPNSSTLFMNPGDVLKVVIQDITVPAYSSNLNGSSYTVPAGPALLTEVQDLTTHQTGYMVASAANGFKDTQGIVSGSNGQPTAGSCGGIPFNFAAEYSSALQQNQVPWAALEGGVLMEDEIGHFEVCSSVTNQLPSGFVPGDSQVFQNCVGGSEGANNAAPEKGCSLTTGNCPGATTQANLACPSPPGGSQPNFTEGLSCEYSDGYCMPAGRRPVSNDGAVTSVSWPVAGCQTNLFQNGDLDFDGTSYQPDWPNGAPNHPTSFEYLGPFTAQGQTYPQVQLETDVAASEAFCNVSTGLGCSVPPVGAAFYPFWTLGRGTMQACGGPGRRGQDGCGQTPSFGSQNPNNSGRPQGGLPQSACYWNFGNVIPGTTINNLGMDSEYGSPNLLRYGGTVISPVMANPQLACMGRGR